MSYIKLPGMIDPHVHFRDPGQTHKEDFYTGTSAALAGGYTTVIDMPNNKIPITTKQRLDEKIAIAKEKIVCDVGFHFGSLGDNLDEFAKVEPYVMGLKLYLNETTGNFLITKDMIEKIFTAWPARLASQPASQTEQGGQGESVAGRPANRPILLHAEDDAVSYVIEIVRKVRKHAHFCHISTSSDLQQIMDAKEEGLPISCGITPHHLFLTAEEGAKLGAFGTMKPPLRTQKEIDFLWKNLAAIDIVESDHAPHTIEEKTGRVMRVGDPHRVPAVPVNGTRTSDGGNEQQDPPYKTPYGVPGIETQLPLLLTAVAQNRLTLDDVVRLCHINPAKIFGVKIDSNTYIEIDMAEEYKIVDKQLHTKCVWSPFNGWKMKGRVKTVFIRGEKVFENDTIIAHPGSGRILP